MKSQNDFLKHFQPPITEQSNNTSKMRLSDIFAESNGSYLNEFNLFLTYFNEIPNYINRIEINCKKASWWFYEKYKNDIINLHYNKRYFCDALHATISNTAEYDEVFYVLCDNLIVYFDTNKSTVKLLFGKTDIENVEAILEGFNKFKIRISRCVPTILLLVNRGNGIDTKRLEIKKPKLNIADNYNDDFIEVHDTIFKRLSKKNDKGLVLLHGKPGTGKTSYLRYLAAMLKKEIIFLPPNMADAITNPNLISVLIENPDSIFIIEDAENIIMDREKNGYSPVSTLLNISDGLLSDCLNIQLICSFNTDISKVDSALTRKGRLIAKYEFKELEATKAQALSGKLGFNTLINAPMTLSAIYNQDERDYQSMKKAATIGFKAVCVN